MISIIIPAHNEGSVIGRLLERLIRDAGEGELEIIVGCNGCTDNTAEICREFSPAIKVLETDEASKIAGLNIADQAASHFPRMYIDADVSVDIDALRKVAAALGSDGCLAAAPQMEVDLSRSSFLVRAFYRLWLQLPYHQKGMIGSGFYALSQDGRSRFGEFPKIIADDGFVRALFSEKERVTLADCSFKISAPTNLWDLIRIKSRSRLGLWELGRRFPDSRPREKKNWAPSLKRLISKPSAWLASPVYLFVVLMAKFRAKRMLHRLSEYRWERDESSRQVA